MTIINCFNVKQCETGDVLKLSIQYAVFPLLIVLLKHNINRKPIGKYIKKKLE